MFECFERPEPGICSLDQLTLSIAAGAAASAATAMAQGVSTYSANSAKSQEARYNATVLQQQGTADVNTAAGNEASVTRQSAVQLGTQAAAAGQAGIGTGGTLQGVERQSATNARMDALNVWYGGDLQKYQADTAANEERYSAKVDQSNANTDLLTGGLGVLGAAGTGIAQGYGAKQLLASGLSYGGGFG